VFAILGLRSMYFAVAGLMKIFRFLHTGLALVLVLVGLKMIVAERFPISTLTTLGLIAVILLISVGVSVVCPAKSSV
jgi:tellurite resistance protein TerC